jgi:hypothetical protein
MSDQWDEEARRVIHAMARVIAEDIDKPLDGVHVALVDEQVDIIAAALREAYAEGARHIIALMAKEFRSRGHLGHAPDQIVGEDDARREAWDEAADDMEALAPIYAAPAQPAAPRDDADRLLDASTLESEVDDILRADGLDPEALRAKGAAFVESLRNATPRDGGAGERCDDQVERMRARTKQIEESTKKALDAAGIRLASDLMHQTGRCECAGEGRCAWCQATNEALGHCRMCEQWEPLSGSNRCAECEHIGAALDSGASPEEACMGAGWEVAACTKPPPP